MKRDSRRGKLLKSLAYRALAFGISFIVTYVATGSLQSAGTVAVAIEFTKFILYYTFETGWNHISKFIFEDEMFEWECESCGNTNESTKPPRAGSELDCSSCGSDSKVSVEGV